MEEKSDIEVLVFPFGAATAGVRRGASKLIIELGSAVNV